MTIGESLKRFRKEMDLTQRQIAADLEIHHQSYQGYEYDKNVPSANVILRLATTYNVSTDYLLGLSDVPRNPKVSDADRKLIDAAIAYEIALKNALKEHGEI